jgi:DNA-binding IclR family transcriptional regulator
VSQPKGVLGRYALLLDTLAAAPAGLTLTEIMQATDLPRGTVHRLIRALLEVGYIEPSDGRKVYVLGARLLRMIHLGTPAQVIVSLVRPLLERLSGRFDETAFLAKLFDREVRSMAMVVPSSSGSTSYVQPGRVMPLNAAASAKAIFAFQEPAVFEQAMARPLEKFTAKAIVEKGDVEREMELVRRNGFAVCDEELDPGVFSYACPVHLDDAGVLYSVGLVGLSERLNRFSSDAVIVELRAAAAEFAALLSNR